MVPALPVFLAHALPAAHLHFADRLWVPVATLLAMAGATFVVRSLLHRLIRTPVQRGR